ncbi:hypothetical protein DLM45_13810 [Hyphomicrobium methylovorum]|uniref:hypothetical protein n=1 Tax=Hyphomicrobium methylovorum TaxID=84 RepID=UPI0015E7CE03|nr:hypothetical protein [Hyphomicrobium methylovorum]MBA2127291.1 hypothetical protein [Hyphomicrobium methylovorum]
MLRRYLLVNGISTAVLYGAILALAPVVPHVLMSARETLSSIAMESPALAPIVYRIVIVQGGGG